MKLIKAFIRTSRVDPVIRGLDRQGAPGITLSRVHGVGYGYEKELFTLAPSEYQRTLEVTKIEVVCTDEQADGLVASLVRAARTGDPGDGIVFVKPVERAVKIRSGHENEDALRKGPSN